MYDAPRIAEGPGVLTELERERKRSQNTRPSDTALSHYGSHGTQRSNAKLCDVADGGRILAAEGINRKVKRADQKIDFNAVSSAFQFLAKKL